MSLRNDIMSIQRLMGVKADGVLGPITARAVLDALRGEQPVVYEPGSEIDARSGKVFRSLLPRAQGAFAKFYRLAQATAASMGCEYIAISGTRSWNEQEALYAKGRTTKGPRVTNARAGDSWHNFGVAADFGVFRGKIYLDDKDPDLAYRVHGACAKHAEACGIEWGGNWQRFEDMPHYQLFGQGTLANARKLHQEGKWK